MVEGKSMEAVTMHSARRFFETSVRKIGPGASAVLDGLRNPLRIREAALQNPAISKPDGVGRIVDALA